MIMIILTHKINFEVWSVVILMLVLFIDYFVVCWAHTVDRVKNDLQLSK